MELYLMRHGSAFSKEVNPEQPLSPLGQEQIQKAAKVSAKLGQEFAAIAASPKLRARQTARIMAAATNYPANKIIISDSLLPSTPVTDCLEFILSLPRPSSLMLCAHLPLLEHLASHLLSDCSLAHFNFETGSLMRLDVTSFKEQNATLRWFLTPKQLQLMAQAV